ncbi:conserved exported hypothetical protein [Xenorhabdus bovienii str. oregonense]|uniref:Uncharacterized protein n=1 Tax=Xenorhabdus bovienii str. oregonense TaxID=1398202 RepID=A0A077P9M8_XENBV|nr:conserved exported hypothetical protein [Xenorhabdus bovienii str. oregonense]
MLITSEYTPQKSGLVAILTLTVISLNAKSEKFPIISVGLILKDISRGVI